MFRFITILILLISLVACSSETPRAEKDATTTDTTDNWQNKEKHLANIKQLTFGGQNAEAYFSAKGDQLVFQAMFDSMECDQIFLMNSDGSDRQLVSTGKGVTTCSFISPDHQKVIYASTHAGDSICPPKPDFRQGYVWALYKDYEIYSANPDGSDLVNISNSPRYDAEAVYSPDGSMIVFTSLRTGDLEIFTMKPDGSDLKQLTNQLGYDGGAFFSYDNKKIIFRASRPATSEDSSAYVNLLAKDLIKPSNLEIFIMNIDGTDIQQITNLGGANFAPYLHPGGTKLVFCSNYGGDPRQFNLWLINVDGTGLERLTYNPTFDGFPMWSHDGKKFVFCSNRDNKIKGETNVFIADWVE